MVTEVMLALIAAGVVLMLAVRVFSGRRERAKEEDMKRSTDILKKELERSGSTIIQRMGTHVNKLERLIREAESENARLLSRLDEVTSARDSLQQQLAEARTLTQQLAEQQRQINMQMQQSFYPPPAMPQSILPRFAPNAGNAVAANDITDAVLVGNETFGRSNRDFSQMLRESVAREEEQAAAYEPRINNTPVNPPSATGYVPAKTSASPKNINENAAPFNRPVEYYEDEEYDEEEYVDDYDDNSEQDNRQTSARERAKEMLLAGKSVEETARETGIGHGAAALMLQMLRRKQ